MYIVKILDNEDHNIIIVNATNIPKLEDKLLNHFKCEDGLLSFKPQDGDVDWGYYEGILNLWEDGITRLWVKYDPTIVIL